MRPLRNPVVQAVLAGLLAQWMRFCFATIRWTHRNEGVAERIWADGGGVACAFWHSRIALAPACWPLDRAQPPKVLISLSPDGQFLARAVGRLGFPAIRGSSANKDKGDRAKGGSQALRDGLKQLKVGALGVTPDGPRGPARQMAEGLPFAGFIGLSRPAYEAAFLPAVEVGWRLDPRCQGLGLATEGARAALAFGFDHVGLDQIIAVAPRANTPSIRVMQRLGMTADPAEDFDHPALADHPAIRRCTVHRIDRATFEAAA